METTQERIHSLKLVGGTLCLDFVNTVDWRTDERRQDLLSGYDDLIAWGRRVGAIRDDQARTLRKRVQSDPNAARAALDRAVGLREAIYRLFSALVAGRRVPGRALAQLNKTLVEARAHLRLVPLADGVAWSWHGVEDRLDWPAWLAARSAAELLTSARRDRVRQCAGPGCGWLFLDASRNRTRRWCDMADCGNRAKARRSYARKRSRRTANGMS